MADVDLLRADEAARIEALDVARSFIVQAPAGSGKTELLIQRYLRLLAVVDHPEEVLAITFTRKAAAEMRLRVLQALQAGLDAAQPVAAHERITWEAARAALARDARLDWQLSRNPRRMRILTLDSLNGSIARSQPVTSSAGAAAYSIVADSSMNSLYREAAAATLDQLAETGDYRAAATDVLRHLDMNAWLYIGYLERMLATRDQWLPFIGSGAMDEEDATRLRESLEYGLELAVANALDSVRSAFPAELESDLLAHCRYAAGNLADSTAGDSTIACLGGIDAFPAADSGRLPQWLGIAELLLTREGLIRKRVNRNQGFPTGDSGQKQAFQEFLQSLSATDEFARRLCRVRNLPRPTYSDEQWSVLMALFRLLPLAVTELKRLFAVNGIADHIEVALSASGALGTAASPGDVALLLDYQIRHILVDEMQDTSSAQYRMIEALMGGWGEGDGRTLFCVGDPMQSIYRFRNAEVGQFLLAREAGIGDLELQSLTLRRNFRSGEFLVHWFNTVFPLLLPDRDDPRQGAVAYSEAVPVASLRDVGDVQLHALIEADPEQEADRALQVIRDTLATHPDDDMAVLVRGRTHLPELLYRLRDAGIAYRAVEIDRLTDLPEITDVLALTRALVHLGDRHAWLAILRSPWVGLDWSDLLAIVRNDLHSTVWSLIEKPDVLARLSDSGRAAVAACRAVLAAAMQRGRAETLRERIERCWIALGGPALVAGGHEIENVYRFLDVLESNETAGDLADVARLEAILDSEHVSSPADARLQIMTMHRAKGLQFDHVLLLGLGRVPRLREPRVLSWFDIPDVHGRPHKVISPVGPRAELERDEIHAYIDRVEGDKDRLELGRLLYVACTRARKSLQLIGSARLRRSGVRPEKHSLLALLWPAVANRYESLPEPDAGVGDDAATEDWLLPVLRRLRDPWQAPDVPPAPGITATSGASAATPVEFDWVGAGARLAGTLAHRWIQLCTAGRIDLGIDDYAPIRDRTRRWLNEMGISGELVDPVVARVETSLRGITNDAKGRWLLGGEGHAELALTGVHGTAIESVVLDRVRVADDGTHWIVDYKTSSHEGGDLSVFLASEADRYKAQLLRYANIYRNWSGADVRCALYFPLLQQFVEVEVGCG